MRRSHARTLGDGGATRIGGRGQWWTPGRARAWVARDARCRGRLPRRRGRGHGHGVHRRPDRPRRRARRARRPPPGRRWSLAPRLPVRAPAPVLHLLRRRVDGAGRRADPGGRARGGTPRAGGPADDLRLLRPPAGGPDARVGPGRVLRRLRLPRRPHLRPRSSQVSGSRCRERCRIVDARYLAPDIPAETPPRFAVDRGCAGDPGQRPRGLGGGSEPVRRRRLRQDRDRCLHLAAAARGGPRRDLLGAAPRALDAEPGADPAGSRHLPRHGRRHDAVCGGVASSLDDLFLRLEDAGIMLRIDRSVTPTMAKAPTLGTWELELLRTIEHVVRRGHIDTVRRGRIDLRRRVASPSRTTPSS